MYYFKLKNFFKTLEKIIDCRFVNFFLGKKYIVVICEKSQLPSLNFLFDFKNIMQTISLTILTSKLCNEYKMLMVLMYNKHAI